MTTDLHADILSKAFKSLLGRASKGSMAFVRCLSSEMVRALCQSGQFAVRGWKVWGVTDRAEQSQRLITADYAVELREDKGEAVLLLVDTASAGTGMDGIYSAVREIGESELFTEGCKQAQKTLPRNAKTFIREAVKKSRRVGRGNTISPFQKFDFYLKCGGDSETIGAALSVLGLWPVQFDGKTDIYDIDRSIQLVERLLLSSSSSMTPEGRVEALMLSGATEEQRLKLVRFVREASGLNKLEAAARLADEHDLWLNAIRPGIFEQNRLRKMDWVPWLSNAKRPTAWSGLRQDGEGRLHFVLNRNHAHPKERSKLEIRWKTIPEELAKGSVEFRVVVFSGEGNSEEELAEKRIPHSGKMLQKCVFTRDDFADLEEDANFEAKVRIEALGCDATIAIESYEDFLLRFGESQSSVKSSVGKKFRALVEGAVALHREEFEKVCSEPNNLQIYSKDAKGHISFQYKGVNAKVYCPSLVDEVEKDWVARQGAPGRWVVKIRSDGTQAELAKFIGHDPGNCPPPVWDRLITSCRSFSSWASGGLLGVIHGTNKGTEEYVNAWFAALEASDPFLALAQTVEVQSLSGKTIGLIVLPAHPLRVAWHHAYDLLVQHARFQSDIAPRQIEELVKPFDGSYFPAFLPGLKSDETFVFGDMLGFHAVAMVSTLDREPKATVALLAALLAGGNGDIAPSIGSKTSDVLAKEVKRYSELHPDYDLLHVHTLRAGVGRTVAKALGKALSNGRKQEIEEDESERNGVQRFVLELYPTQANHAIVGRFLSATIESKRSGAGMVPEEDRWMLDSICLPGEITVPKLSWAKRHVKEPQTPAHLSLAFDTFDTRVEPLPVDHLKDDALFEAYGLIGTPSRIFLSSPHPCWKSFVTPDAEGEKHPAGRGLTERLIKVHHAVLRATGRSLGSEESGWPVLFTEISSDKEESLQRLHRLSDWVITVDRNAGVEYFDSPREKPGIYDAYIIDCVPEQEDLGLLQLVTSTSNFQEVVTLLDRALGEMTLSASPRNCKLLLDELKALSGRMAMRLTGAGKQAQELIGLALAHSQCRQSNPGNGPWVSLQEGFFVPLDEVPDLFPGKEGDDESQFGRQRADLLYVSCERRGGLRFSFVEVKFRRYLKTARSSELLEMIVQQISCSKNRWDQLYGSQTNLLEKVVRHGRLARLLRFYADKGRRHHLAEEAFQRILKEINKMVREGSSYILPALAEQEVNDRGYVFCPEYSSSQPILISVQGQLKIYMFGPAGMPDNRYREQNVVNSASTQEEVVVSQEPSAAIQQAPLSEQQAPCHSDSALIHLGHDGWNEESVDWTITIKSNPHLMMVGLPGMGKTTCLINICEQMLASGIAPIVFSYHDDIDGKLEARHEGAIHYVDYAGLGFNPLEVVRDEPLAHIDNVGMLRDIFSSIFPDLGEIQLGRLREALKRSYQDQGWGEAERPPDRPRPPEFQAFYDLLKSEPKPEKGLLNRLGELDDYGFFQSASGTRSLLDLASTTLIRIHKTQNEVLQRAFSTFILHNLYQNMFLRGTQVRITHAIIFDEAHRAAKLKLLPTMAKECRKYGIALVVASQEVKDFDPSLSNAIANNLVLRINESDAKIMAKIMATSEKVSDHVDRIKALSKYHGFFHSEERSRPVYLALDDLGDGSTGPGAGFS